MKTKPHFSTELAYALGIVLLAFGTTLMEKADLGMSMVVAPAYVIYRLVSQSLTFFTFGMAEYLFQAVLLLLLSLVLRRAKVGFLFSFVTAFLYGIILDFFMACLRSAVITALMGRALFFGGGMVICGVGVALLFHTYLPPEAYELFVKECAERFGWPIGRVKTVYDWCSCLLAVLLSLVFFRTLVGVKLGTFFCAALNGLLIGRFSAALDALFRFTDSLPLRRLFQN